jgi:hypothetical protein
MTSDFEKEVIPLHQQLRLPEEVIMNPPFERRIELCDQFPKIATLHWHEVVEKHKSLLAAYNAMLMDVTRLDKLTKQATKGI